MDAHRGGDFDCITDVVLSRQPWVGSATLATLNDPKAAPRAVSPRASFGRTKSPLLRFLDKHSPAVVNLLAIGVQRDLFTLNLYQIPQGTGSGFVWDTKGNIITNFHVIQNAAAAQVT